MAELTKTKIIDIQTGQATKNVENLTNSFVPLRKQIRDLVNQMAQLEQGTEEYNAAAIQLADLQQRQVEVTEAAKYANRDFGAVMSNLTTVSLGFAGGINAISASMALLGGDAEQIQKAVAPIQLLMAVIQGFSAVDNAIKSLKGLNNILEGIGKTVETVKDNLDIEVDVDTTKAEKSVKNIDKYITKVSKTKKVTIDADTNKAEKSVKTITGELDGISGKKIEIEADTTEVDSSLTRVSEELDGISGKKIEIEADTEVFEDSLEDITDKLDDLSDIDVEVKAEGLDNVTKEVKNLGEAEKTLATNAQTATTATNNLNTATASTATNVGNITKGVKQAATATTALAAGEGVATKATWTLNGALKAVGTAIKSIPVIGWIAMGVTLLTQLIKLIVGANKESKEGEKITREILQAEKDRLEVLGDIEDKYRKIRKELKTNIQLLKILPKDSREYKTVLDEIATSLVLSTEYVEAHTDSLDRAVESVTKMNEIQDKMTENEKAAAEAAKSREKLEKSALDALRAGYDESKEILESLVDGGEDGVRITEKQSKQIAKIRKQRIKGTLDQNEAEQAVLEVIQDQSLALLETETRASNANENRTGGLQKELALEKEKVNAIQTESDAYDEMLKKQKESQEAAAEYYKKYKDAQKSYLELMEDMKIADAEYNGDWNRYADERKNKAERIYNDDLKEYQRQLKEKLITQEQYNELLTQREEQYNNDTAQIALDTNKKMWDEQLNTALEEIEKEKQERKKAYEDEYVVNVKANVSGADDTRNIQEEQAELDAILKTNEVLKERLTIVQENKDESKEYADYVKQLQDQIAENEQKAQELQLQIDLDGYEKRKKQVEEYYNSIDQLAADRINKSIIDNNGEGNKMFLEQQKIELQAIQDKMEAVRKAYDDGLITQAEYNSKSLQLQAEYVTKSREFDQQHMQSILQTANTYSQTVQMIGSSISGVLQEVMSNYDENSEEYKKMAVANAVIQTISGQLGAFFSGVNSGVPAPWNFLLGGVLATAALTTGLIGIANIKSGKLGGNISGNISSSASNLGRGEYETTAYAQNAELMSNVTDQRVYVLEHDISSAQSNVNVLEHDNSF